MKDLVKGGLIGFILFFIGLWIFLFATGSDVNGWKCAAVSEPYYCTFSTFISSPIHWGFVIFFSLVGLIGGVIDIKIFKKTLYNLQMSKQRKYLKITSTMILTLVIVIGLVGILAFDNWVVTMIYVIIFAIFTIAAGWIIGKKRYGF